MKKKMLLFAAFVAAGVAFTSCSSEDDLTALDGQGQQSQQEEIIPETVKGTPFSVTVNNEDGTTRATLIDNSTLEKFKLFAKQGSNDPWINGNVFKYESDGDGGNVWNPYKNDVLQEMTWPTDDKDTESKFYAYSDNSADGVTVSATTPTTSCVITDNLKDGSFVYQFYKDSNADNHKLIKEAKRGTNTYTGDDDNAKIVDLSKQSDLLVASATQKEEDGTTVGLNFRHTLASLALKARFTSLENGATTGGINEDENIEIYWIRIHGLKGGGTFTFPTTDNYDPTTHRWATSPWTTDGGTDVIFEKVFSDDASSPLVIESQEHRTGDEITKTTLIEHTELLVVPQKFTPWFVVANYPQTAPGAAPANCYIEINMKTKSSSARTRNSYYIPLNITSTDNELLTGVKHTVTLNLNYIANVGGSYIFSPSDAGGSGARPFEIEIE